MLVCTLVNQRKEITPRSRPIFLLGCSGNGVFSILMATNKRYFWLKLKTDFFDQDDIKVIRGMPNGSKYIIFWQQLLLKAITAQEPGLLRYKENIPYDEKILSTVTHTDIDIVRAALKLFVELNMIQKMDDGSLWIEQIDEMVGTETTEAIRKRIYRAKTPEWDNVPRLSHNVPDKRPPELEIEKEIEKEKKRKYADFVFLTESEYKKLVTSYGDSETGKMIEKLSNYKGAKGKKYKSDYRAILNWVVGHFGYKKTKTVEFCPDCGLILNDGGCKCGWKAE